MSKILIIPSNIDEINEFNNYDGIILGIENLSINMPFYVRIEEIKDIVENLNNLGKDVFISLNKNMHNNDLLYLKNTLLELSKLNIKAILYYDISIVNIKKELNLNIELVWSQEHMTTNYYTANYWYDKKVNYMHLSSEITIDEMKSIKENTKMILLADGFGYIPMFASRRPLVKNYLKTFNLNDNSKINYLFKENKTYPIIDSETGTVVYTDKPLNIIKELINIEMDYIILNSFNVEKQLFKNILDLINDKKYEKINNLLETSTYFLNKETVYKVKKND